jgi:hypothetical protein
VIQRRNRYDTQRRCDTQRKGGVIHRGGDVIHRGDVIYRLIDYLRFYVPLKNFSLIWRCHHCR